MNKALSSFFIKKHIYQNHLLSAYQNDADRRKFFASCHQLPPRNRNKLPNNPKSAANVVTMAV